MNQDKLNRFAEWLLDYFENEKEGYECLGCITEKQVDRLIEKIELFEAPVTEEQKESLKKQRVCINTLGLLAYMEVDHGVRFDLSEKTRASVDCYKNNLLESRATEARKEYLRNLFFPLVIDFAKGLIEKEPDANLIVDELQAEFAKRLKSK